MLLQHEGLTTIAIFSIPLAVREISRLLKTGLDDNSLRICVQLCEAGVNPEALATVIQELRREAAALKVNYTVKYEMCSIL